MATEIVDGKLLEIRYVRPDVTLVGGSGKKNTVEEGDEDRAWNLEEASNISTGHASGMELRFINSISFTSDTTARTFSNSGTGDQPIVFSGRNLGDTAYENAYLNRGGSATVFSGNHQIIRYLDFNSSATSRTVQVIGGKSIIYNCKIKNTAAGGATNSNALYITLGIAFNNYIENMALYTTHTLSGALRTNQAIIFGNKIISTDRGVWLDSHNLFFNNLVIGRGIGSGVFVNSYGTVSLIKNNTIYNFNYGFDTVASSGTSSNQIITNNLFHTISGINNPSDPSACVALRISKLQSDYFLNCFGNRYYNCDYFMVEDKYDNENLDNNVELSADPFVHTDVNPSFDANPPDYSLNNVTGGGVVCKNISSPVYTWTWNH